MGIARSCAETARKRRARRWEISVSIQPQNVPSFRKMDTGPGVSRGGGRSPPGLSLVQSQRTHNYTKNNSDKRYLQSAICLSVSQEKENLFPITLERGACKLLVQENPTHSTMSGFFQRQKEKKRNWNTVVQRCHDQMQGPQQKLL